MRRQERVPWDNVEGRGHTLLSGSRGSTRQRLDTIPALLHFLYNPPQPRARYCSVKSKMQAGRKLKKKKKKKRHIKAWPRAEGSENHLVTGNEANTSRIREGKHLQHSSGEAGSLSCPVPVLQHLIVVSAACLSHVRDNDGVKRGGILSYWNSVSFALPWQCRRDFDHWLRHFRRY